MVLNQFFTRKNLIQFSKFVIVGGSSFIIDFSINTLVVWILTIDLRVESIIANICSYTVALLYNYTLSSRWTFRSVEIAKRSWARIKFVLVNLFNLFWTTLLITLLVDLLHDVNLGVLNPYIQPISKIVVTSISVPVSYILYRKLVFRD